MSDLSTTEWLAAQRNLHAQSSGAFAAFWPEFQRLAKLYSEDETFKGWIRVHADSEESRILILSCGVFDLKIAGDPASDTVFYAFTSATLKKLIPRDSAIFAAGAVKLARGYWGVIDLPHNGSPGSLVGDPQAVEQVSLAERFARWCFEQLAGGYDKISALAPQSEHNTSQDLTEGDKLRARHEL